MSHQLLLTMPAFIEENKTLIIILIIGAIAGYLAQFLVPGRGYGLLVTIIIGMIGGWLGNRFLGFINFNTDIPFLNEIIRAIIGSVVIVIILNLILGNREGEHRKDRDVYDWENE